MDLHGRRLQLECPSRHQFCSVSVSSSANGSDLALFPADHFDFVYSLFVFQHVPSAEVVFSYLRETVRVLKPGGSAFNGVYATSEWVNWGETSNPDVQAFLKACKAVHADCIRDS